LIENDNEGVFEEDDKEAIIDLQKDSLSEGAMIDLQKDSERESKKETKNEGDKLALSPLYNCDTLRSDILVRPRQTSKTPASKSLLLIKILGA
jgi:hypothetical protein